MTLSETARGESYWANISAQLDAEGYALLPHMLTPERARELALQADTLESICRVSLDSIDLGLGEILRFGSSLPTPWAEWRPALYRRLVPIANRWNETLNIAYRYPTQLNEFLQHNRNAGQTQQRSWSGPTYLRTQELS